MQPSIMKRNHPNPHVATAIIRRIVILMLPNNLSVNIDDKIAMPTPPKVTNIPRLPAVFC